MNNILLYIKYDGERLLFVQIPSLKSHNWWLININNEVLIQMFIFHFQLTPKNFCFWQELMGRPVTLKFSEKNIGESTNQEEKDNSNQEEKVEEEKLENQPEES